MNNQIFIWAVIFIGMFGTLYGMAKSYVTDTGANNDSGSIGGYFKDNILLVIGCLLIFLSIVFGANLGNQILVVDTAAGLFPALITGAGIPAIVKRWILPIFGIEADVARKNLREAIQTKANVADIASAGK